MPLDTIEAFIDHGRLERTLDRDVEGSRQAIHEVEAGGVASFAKSFHQLMDTIESKRGELAHAS